MRLFTEVDKPTCINPTRLVKKQHTHTLLRDRVQYPSFNFIHDKTINYLSKYVAKRALYRLRRGDF